jgi:hypothetical protein
MLNYSFVMQLPFKFEAHFGYKKNLICIISIERKISQKTPNDMLNLTVMHLRNKSELILTGQFFLQWILTKLGTYLVVKRIWNPIDFQGHRSRLPGQIFYCVTSL